MPQRKKLILRKYESEIEVAQSCPTLCDTMDGSLPGFSFHGISRQEYWSGLPFPSPGDLPDPGIEPRSPTLQADTLPSESQGKHKIVLKKWPIIFWHFYNKQFLCPVLPSISCQGCLFQFWKVKWHEGLIYRYNKLPLHSILWYINMTQFLNMYKTLN